MLRYIPAVTAALALAVVAAALALAVVAAAPARATASRANNDSGLYALTMTAQQISANSKTITYKLVAANSSTTSSLKPTVRLDQSAKLASSSEPVVVGHVWTTWRVGLKPGETKVLTVKYHRQVKLGSVTQIVGKTYWPSFQLYDTRTPKRITFVNVAQTESK